MTAPEVPRDRDPAAYVATATEWQARRAALYAEMIERELADGGTGGFLVWGDPSLYDGTLNLLHGIAEQGQKLEIVSVPGISSVAALAAAHGLILNRVGTPILITTGRRLADGGHAARRRRRRRHARRPHRLRRAARHGSRHLLGRLPRHAGRDPGVRRPARGRRRDPGARAEARARKGWIMDTYLLRRRR